MTRAAEARSAPISGMAGTSALQRYFKRSELPLASLIFLLPAVILFEVGTWLHPSNPIAFDWLHLFFQQLGATGQFLPALSIVGILLSWHIARKDSWQLHLSTLWLMLIESWGLALPLLAFWMALTRLHLQIPLSASVQAWRDQSILSLGAGIYEELVFRLILMTILSLILGDLIRVPRAWTDLLMVVISAVSFSLYHYLGREQFELQTFVFRTVAGIYFGVLFLTRGFGVTAGCHIAYDLIDLAQRVWLR